MPAMHDDIRRYLVEELKKDLVGPGKPDEELTDSPTIHYLAGILYPSNVAVDVEEDDDANQAPSDDEDEMDSGTLISASSNPSSIGMTFVVKNGETVSLQARAAKYTPEKDATSQYTIWKRRELEIQPIIHVIARSDIARKEITEDLELLIRVRDRGGTSVVTVTLINTHKTESKTHISAEYCFFQPSIEARSDGKTKSIFLARQINKTGLQDADRELNDLLYRHAPEFAVGHGCSVGWETNDNQTATRIHTEIIPGYEILQMSPDSIIEYKSLGMKFLATAKKKQLIGELQKISSAYSIWIGQQKDLIPSLPEKMRAVASRNMENCSQVLTRIVSGIQLLEKNEMVRESFQLANQAMLTQRARIVWMKQKPESGSALPVLSEEHRWRPFQIAFMLMCIGSIENPLDETRLMVDLLWFPTGGGKTEAYLGLTAFTIFLRRFKHKERGSGVAVLMRYTLRLLTIQQFQRAATLIMACENIRRSMSDHRLGHDPISLGLWVGGSATPNSLKDAKSALLELVDGERVLEGNPFQILSCPWCGKKLSPRDYQVSSSMKIQCSNRDCDFSSGMPLFLVDEDIYSNSPSLLIGTVDKFARMPWMAQVSELFGRGKKNVLPPELIIQDELHLISGPLGTLVGLYETAVDILCQKDGIPPKIIASTATIRRAGEQCKGLFNRSLTQFPPSALDARDTFFSKQVSQDEKPGRLYIGVNAPGKSMKTALLRIYAVLLQKIYTHQGDLNLRDPYWTLVGYFNSMRELGGAVRLAEDDVRERIRVLAMREDGDKKVRYLNNIAELNSRLGADEIPDRLDAMSLEMKNPGAIDVLLATNMISVGVDIDRLGLMVVTGQPKMSSEYIQATSRVGRKYPGLVITLYNWTRPRDRSHYERFVGYHSAIYSHVESTSVTPFSSRARDRGLHGVFISLVRHMIRELTPEEAAVNFSPSHPVVKKIIDLIVERVALVDPLESEDTKRELEDIVRRWDNLARPGTLSYGPSHKNLDLLHLMHPAEKKIEGASMFPTLNSLRDVEGQSGLFSMSSRKK